VNRWRYASSPLLLNGKLFLGIGQAGIAMDPHNGQVQWESPAGHPGYSSPVPYRHAGQDTLVFFSGHAVTAVEPASGRRRWSVPWNTLWDLNAADPILHEQRLFVSSGNGVGCALYDLAPPQPRELWRNRNLKTTLNASVRWNGFLYGFNDTHLACISWETGEEQWSTRDVRNGSLIVAGGTLVLLSETGKLVVAHPTEKAYEPLAAAQVLSGRCWTTPVLSRGRLFVRNAAGEVVALDLRPAAR
jgi:outer membrane protein assembly factor BamB